MVMEIIQYYTIYSIFIIIIFLAFIDYHDLRGWIASHLIPKIVPVKRKKPSDGLFRVIHTMFAL